MQQERLRTYEKEMKRTQTEGEFYVCHCFPFSISTNKLTGYEHGSGRSGLAANADKFCKAVGLFLAN